MFLFVYLFNQNIRELLNLLHRENRFRVLEFFDNVAYVLLGTVEIREEDKDYLTALQKKYTALRDRVFIMCLKNQHGMEWNRCVLLCAVVFIFRILYSHSRLTW